MFAVYGANGMIGKVDVSYQYVPYELYGTIEYQVIRSDYKSFYNKDHLGSIRQTIGSNGTVSATYDYSPFGEIISSYVSNGSDKYKFTQKERDTETNLDYFGARYYDSEIGRWLSPDPLADKYPGWSPYNYCMNNPVNLVDPDGRWPWVANIFYTLSQKLTPYNFSEDNGVRYANRSELDVKGLNRSMSSLVNKWKASSPIFSEYLKNNSVAVAFAEYMPNNYKGLDDDWFIGANGNTIQKIIIDQTYIEENGDKGLEVLIMHELCHKIYDKLGEYGAYSVNYSTGLLNKKAFINWILYQGGKKEINFTPIQLKKIENGMIEYVLEEMEEDGNKLRRGE